MNAPLPVKVSLVTATEWPIETIFALWEASRSNKPIPTTLQIASRGERDPEFKKEVRSTFQKVLDSGIPVAENVWFTFLLENVSIELREQMVRHRIGVKVGERLGCDIVPDLADSTWWSQSMRILDMGQFYEEGRYRCPESADTEDKKAIFEASLQHAGLAYQELVKLGMPMEDARGVIPLAATHRISWTLNLAALKHIIGKRGCWILQLGVWEPVIRGMVEELATKVDAIFRNLIAPPCIEGGKFTSCKFKLDNERRIQGEDEIPPCALYLSKHPEEAVAATLCATGAAWKVDSDGWYSDQKRVGRMALMRKQYGDLWGRSVDTGELRG